MKQKIYYCLLFFVSLNCAGFAQDNEMKFTTDEMKLFQWLMSCQSMSYLVVSGTNNSQIGVLLEKGNKWYNNAYQQFMKLQGGESLDDKTRENISALLQLYSKVFNDIEFRNKTEVGLALKFAESTIRYEIEKMASS